MESSFPKVLILNSYGFNDYTGGGITLKNLFTGWPLDKIALAHWDLSEPMEELCINYYRFGYEDNHFIFPLNYISNEPHIGVSGPYKPKNGKSYKTGVSVQENAAPIQANPFKRIFLSSLNKSGLSEYVHPLKLTKRFEQWVMDFNPDIIYSQCGSIASNTMLCKAQILTGAKVVTHTMDDWPSTIYKEKLFSWPLRFAVHKKFIRNLRKASLRLGISEAMAAEYEKRYKLPFKYFHNPVNCSEYNNLPPKLLDNKYTVVYAGRIGIASSDAIAEFAQCVNSLRLEGKNVTFKIYADINKEVSGKFNYEGVEILPSLKDINHIEKIAEADLLLYPVDFSAESIEYIRLSFPTKLPSYLSSGVPVFCYGPSNVYSIDFMINKQLGFVCTHQNISILKETLIKALEDNNKKAKFAEASRKYAIDNFDKAKVQQLFHNELKKVHLAG